MSAESVRLDFTVVISFEKSGKRYIARADKLGMVAFGKTRAEAEGRIREYCDSLGSFFREREDWPQEAERYLTSRGVNYRVRVEDDGDLEAVELPVSFGVAL